MCASDRPIPRDVNDPNESVSPAPELGRSAPPSLPIAGRGAGSFLHELTAGDPALLELYLLLAEDYKAGDPELTPLGRQVALQVINESHGRTR